MMSVCADDAARKMMEAIVGDTDMRETSMTDHLDGVLKKVGVRCLEGIGRELDWEGDVVESKMQQQLVVAASSGQ